MSTPTVSSAPPSAGPSAPGSGAGPPSGPPLGPGSTHQRTGPRPAAVRRGLRVAAVLGAVVVVYAVISAVVSRPTGAGYLDITSPHPAGTRALAEILRARGVTVTESTTVADGPAGGGRTVLVTRPELLTPADVEALTEEVRAGSDVVLPVPGELLLDALGVPLREGEDGPAEEETEPGCDLPEAVTAGSTTLGDGMTFAPRPPSEAGGPNASMRVVRCYGDPADAARLAVLTPTSSTAVTGLTGRLVLLGSPFFLTNADLDEAGNAALALGLLARHEQLTWVTPLPGEPDAIGGKTLSELLPPAFWLACLQVLVVLVALACWRGRRLGPPVPEPLPVLVRSTETVEGRGRLYAAARARERAAEALRAGLRARLAERLGLAVSAGRAPDPHALVAAVAEHTGRSPWEIWSLLYGPNPAGPDQSGGSAGTGSYMYVWGPSGPIRYGAPVPGASPGAPAGQHAGHPAGPQTGQQGQQTEQAQAALDDEALVRLAVALDELDRGVGRR